jgi:lycopene beta-cyclase
MPRGARDGVLIAGGGVAGCMAALALARLRPDVPLLIVEEGARFGGAGAQLLFADGLDGEGRALGDAAADMHWPGFYLAFPGFSRKLKGPLASVGGEALHEIVIAALRPDQYRLGTKVVAVRDDALVLDGGETIKAEGAIDARGAANLSMLELLYEARAERDVRTKAPHGVDRPVLVDATAPHGALGYMQVVPLAGDRLRIADVSVSERAQSDAEASARIEAYAGKRGWRGAKIEAERAISRPLPVGGDFASFWRIGGARVAKLGLRGGFLDPLTGTTVADALRSGVLLAAQRDFSGAALHDVFEAAARQAWRKREPRRAINAAIAEGGAEARRALLERLYELDAGTVTRLLAERTGLTDRLKVQRALRG